MISALQAAHQWVIGEDDIAVVGDAYGLTLDPRTATSLGGAVNGVARVCGISGEVVIRVHRPWTTSRRLEAVHRVQTRLRAQGFPIPEIFTSRCGRTWMVLHNRLVEVIRYVPDGHEADSWSEFAVSFSMFGQLHAAFASLGQAAVPAPMYSSYADPAMALAMLTETDDAFASCTYLKGFDTANAIRNEARRLLRLLRIKRAGYEDALPRSFIHGDFVGKNVLLSHGRVTALLDFDRLAYRERIFDVACSSCCMLSRLHRTQRSHIPPTERDLARLASVIAAYEEAAHLFLTPAEVAALPIEMARVQLFPVADAGYLVAAGEMTAALAQTRSVGHHLPRAWWLATHPHLVHQALQRRHGKGP